MNSRTKRIGLIAMSGVRACDKELLDLGLTLPGFVERSQVIASLPSLGLLTLAALTPEAYEVDYKEVIDVRDGDRIGEDYDLVAISTFTAQAPEAYALADRFRRAGVPVFMGGLHVTARPDEALRHCDAVVAGEGELAWPRLLRDWERGDLARLYLARRPGYLPLPKLPISEKAIVRIEEDFSLDDAPIPRYDLLDPTRYNRLTVQTARGCPHKCEFCASSIFLTPRYKVKPAGRVIAEIRAIKRVWPRPFIEFADDNSFVARPGAKALLRALAAERVRWFTEADISIAGDPELLALMRDAGCKQVLIGLESPRAASLEGLETRANWKRRQADHYLKAIAAIQDAGITVNGCFIVGLDHDTPAVFDDVLAFARKAGLFDVQITYQTPFPGTPLYARLEREGRLTAPGAWERYTLFDITFRPSRMTEEELRRGFFMLAKELYSEEETARRREQFFARRRGVESAAGAMAS